MVWHCDTSALSACEIPTALLGLLLVATGSTETKVTEVLATSEDVTVNDDEVVPFSSVTFPADDMSSMNSSV